MKKIAIHLFFLGMVAGLLSCRDAKAEAEATEKAVKKIEVIESEVESTQKQLDQTSQALLDAVNDLDSI